MDNLKEIKGLVATLGLIRPNNSISTENILFIRICKRYLAEFFGTLSLQLLKEQR